jgi:hypothetical protein
MMERFRQRDAASASQNHLHGAGLGIAKQHNLLMRSWFML